MGESPNELKKTWWWWKQKATRVWPQVCYVCGHKQKSESILQGPIFFQGKGDFAVTIFFIRNTFGFPVCTSSGIGAFRGLQPTTWDDFCVHHHQHILFLFLLILQFPHDF